MIIAKWTKSLNTYVHLPSRFEVQNRAPLNRCSNKKTRLQQWSNPSSKRIASEQLSSIFEQILLGTIHKQYWVYDGNFHFGYGVI